MLFMAFAYFYYKRLETYTIMVYNWKWNGVIFAFQKVNLVKALFLFALDQLHFPPPAVEGGFTHPAPFHSFFHSDFLLFP